jgi:hypothetical protein
MPRMNTDISISKLKIKFNNSEGSAPVVQICTDFSLDLTVKSEVFYCVISYK